jgi:hypothetical protein
LDLSFNVGLSTLVDYIIREPFEISLDFLVLEVSSDESLDDVDSSLRINRSLILGGFSNKSLLVSECYIGGSNSISELVGDDFNSSIFENTNT